MAVQPGNLYPARLVLPEELPDIHKDVYLIDVVLNTAKALPVVQPIPGSGQDQQQTQKGE